MLRAGYKPGEAAERVGSSVKKLMERRDTKKLIKQIVEDYTLNADVRRLLQRALVNKGVMDNADDGGDKKLLLQYLQMLAADTEVGVNAPPKQDVTIGISPALKEILDRTVPLPVQIEAPLDIKDAEFEDIKK